MKIAWYAQRLRAMSAGEIVHRVRERLGRRNEAAKLQNISRRAWDGTFADFPKRPWRQQVPPDLRKQLAADQRHWARRLETIEAELNSEPERIVDSYRVVTHRLEPAGLVYLWPISG